MSIKVLGVSLRAAKSSTHHVLREPGIGDTQVNGSDWIDLEQYDGTISEAR